MLSCPSCGHAASLPEWLDHAGTSDPQRRWANARGPACDAGSIFHFGPSTVAIGDIDGAPGPYFIEHERERLGGAAVHWHEGGLRVVFQGRSWFVPVQPLPGRRGRAAGR
jgi:hypothetical protein